MTGIGDTVQIKSSYQKWYEKHGHGPNHIQFDKLYTVLGLYQSPKHGVCVKIQDGPFMAHVPVRFVEQVPDIPLPTELDLALSAVAVALEQVRDLLTHQPADQKAQMLMHLAQEARLHEDTLYGTICGELALENS